MLYYLYDREILSEDFWLEYLDGKIQEKYQSILNSAEAEKQLKESAEEFSNWIKTGPYEEDKEKKENDTKEENKKEKEKEKEEKEKEKEEKEEEEEKTTKKGKKKKKKKKDKKINQIMQSL